MTEARPQSPRTRLTSRATWTVVALVIAISSPEALWSCSPIPPLAAPRDPCDIKELEKSDVQGVKVYAPDGKRFVVNMEDSKQVGQLYIGSPDRPGLTCISCSQHPGGPRPNRYKMQPNWHPSGRWLFVPVERDKYSPPPVLGWSRKYVKGQLRNGLWTNMYAVSPDGRQWHRLTDFETGVKGKPDGYTGPAFTSDGKKAVWSQIVDGNIFVYRPFGKWELILADFEERNGIPQLVNRRNITPPGMHWNEPGGFHPDDESLLFSGSVEKDAQGMDQYILNIRTNKLTNVTNTPSIWDEHGRFSPNGEKILFMSAYPYRDDPSSSRVLSIRTEFMLMNRDGSNLRQLTHFRTKGHPHYDKGGIAANPEWYPDGRGAHLRTLMFPDYIDWTIIFAGPCGGSAPQR